MQWKPSRVSRVLEIGSSGGLLIRQLQADGYRHITGIDISPEAVRLCREHGLTDVHLMDAQRPEFPDDTFDLLIASDVLEHLADESGAVREWHRILKPDGVLIVFVPAFRLLWSEHDEANRHCRRYRLSELNQCLAAQGFHVERRGYWNCLLFPPVALVRLLRRVLPISRRTAAIGDFFPPPRLLNDALSALLRLENRFHEKGCGLPFGVSAMAVVRKPARGGAAGREPCGKSD
ncbi:MAG: methyltransferase domain-containing protein [Verrucomicrobia bacterium]|nr:methyltransferase domain-containing protein [Verrucomicrobiota bacterium]